MGFGELAEWRYYFSVVPTETNVIRDHIAQMTAVQFQAQGNKNVKISDFIIDYDQEPDAKKSPKELKKEMLKQLKGAM